MTDTELVVLCVKTLARALMVRQMLTHFLCFKQIPKLLLNPASLPVPHKQVN